MALSRGEIHAPREKKQPFAVACDEWLHLHQRNVKPSTYAKYRGMMEKHIKPWLGEYTLEDFTPAVLEEFSRNLQEKGLSPKSIKDVLVLLHSVFQFLEKQSPNGREIQLNYPKIPKNQTRVLSRTEQERLIQYLSQNTDEYSFGILLALFTGMRIGEICALRWEDVSLCDRTVTVRSTMQRLQTFDKSNHEKTEVVISDPKSDASARVIPLTESCAKRLASRYCEKGHAFVLTGEVGRYVEPRTLQYKLKKYTKKCGLEGVHFHTLRHTFATRCVEVDFEVKSLSEILGHANPRITLERYVHSSLELKRDNMKKLTAVGF